jgi:hypothetical protein
MIFKNATGLVRAGARDVRHLRSPGCRRALSGESPGLVDESVNSLVSRLTMC